MVLEKINLGEYGRVGFEVDTQMGGLRSVLQLKNGYHISMVTNFNGAGSYYGEWEEQTFEVAILDKSRRYSIVDDIDDAQYTINGGVWSRITPEEIVEKIKIVENL